MGGPARRLTRRIGRRGAFAALFGAAWLIYGYRLAVEPLRDAAGLRLLTHLAPVGWWAAMWVTSGVVAIAASPLRHPRFDATSYVAVLLPALVWSLTYWASWWPLGTYPLGWATGTIWGVICGAIMIASGGLRGAPPEPR